MKTKHIIKKIKKKSRLKSGKTITKLVARKIKHLVSDDKTMSTDKDTSISPVDINIDNTQFTSLEMKAINPSKEKRQRNVKRKRKQLFKKENENESSTSNFQDHNNSEEQTQKGIDDNWKLDNSDDDTQGKDWTQTFIPKEERNISSPLVVEMLTDNLTSLDLPQTFKKDQRRIPSDKKIFHDNNSLRLESPSNETSASIVVAEYINPKDSPRMQNDKQVSPRSSNTKKSNKNRYTNYNKLNDTINDTSNTNISSTTCKDFVKKRSPRRSLNNNSDAEMYHESPQRENIDAHRYVRDLKVPKVYCIRNQVIVIMEKDSKFSFIGKLLVKVLYGAVKIYGFIFDTSNSAMKVYSPRGHSNIVIETSETFLERSISEIWTSLSAIGITPDSESKLQADIDKIQPGMAVVTLENFENDLTLFLKTFCPFKLFPKIRSSYYYSWTDRRRAEIILQSNLYLEQHDDSNCKRLITDPCISTDITEKMLNRWRANEWSCTLVAGGKNVGKSTSVRCLINSLLRTTGKVILVDVDPGQAECTPPGCISYSLIEEPLMGPNFTHLKTPVYQLFLDDVNVSRCITRYLEGVKMLVEKLKEHPVLLPIVVNTMGFTQGVGWDIAVFTIKLFRPSYIVQIMSTKTKNNYNDYFSADVVNKQEFTWTFCDESFIDWNRPCEHDLCITHSHAELFYNTRSNEWNMEPYQQRELAMISYLSDIKRDDNNVLFSRNSRMSSSINEMVSYIAPFSSLCIIPQRLFGVPASRVLSVINGNIVALCGIDLTNEPSEESDTTSTLRVLTQRSSLCTCYGFGIIRGIDMARQEVFINTPLPISMMQHVNCLAGCIPVPPSLLQLHQGAPYVGGNAALPTSRDTRRGYFRMRYPKTSNKSQ